MSGGSDCESDEYGSPSSSEYDDSDSEYTDSDESSDDDEDMQVQDEGFALESDLAELTGTSQGSGEMEKLKWMKARERAACEAGGLDTQQIRNWFGGRRKDKEGRPKKAGAGRRKMVTSNQSKKILKTAFETDPRVPQRGSKRANELRASTGLQTYQIRRFFIKERKRAANDGVLIETVNNEEEENDNLSVQHNRFKHPRLLVRLFVAFDEDPTTPEDGSDRLNHLVSSVQVDADYIQKWFTSRRVLLAAYEEDAITPSTHSERMKKLCAATGQEPHYIGQWFGTHRKTVETEEGRQAAEKKKEWQRQKKILNASYDEDSMSPPRGSERMAELCAATGFNAEYILTWFQVRRKGTGDVFRKKNQKTPKQMEVLLTAFKEDWNPPGTKSDRMQKLIADSGLSRSVITGWFHNHLNREEELQTEVGKAAIAKRETWEKQRKILHDSFEQEPVFPAKGTKRLKRLCAATGLEPKKVQSWFASRRRRVNDEARGKGYWKKDVNYKECFDKTNKQSTSTENDGSTFGDKWNEILIRAFEEDPSVPMEDSDRLSTLCAATGQEPRKLQVWFYNRQVEAKELTKAYHDSITSKHAEILLASFTEDSSIPKIGSDRLNNLIAATGLSRHRTVIHWFKKQRLAVSGGNEQMESDDSEREDAEEEERQKQELVAQKEKWEEHKKILIDAFEQDPTIPKTESERLQQLCEVTGHEPESLQIWFYNRQIDARMIINKMISGKELKIKEVKKKARNGVLLQSQNQHEMSKLLILLLAFEKDSDSPGSTSVRMNKLCKATGYKLDSIKQWFGRQRKKVLEGLTKEDNRKTIIEIDAAEHNKEVLIASFEMDWCTPIKNSYRLKELCIATGLDGEYIQGWFRATRTTFRAKVKEEEKRESESVNVSAKKKSIGELILSARAKEIEDRERATNKENEAEKVDMKPDRKKSAEEMKREKKKEKKKKKKEKKEKKRREKERKEKERNLEKQTTGNDVKKCPICNSARPDRNIAIVSLKEAKRMDNHFGSSIVHFLSYTRSIRICWEHTQEFVEKN